jgi:hypothetical protein
MSFLHLARQDPTGSIPRHIVAAGDALGAGWIATGRSPVEKEIAVY